MRTSFLRAIALASLCSAAAVAAPAHAQATNVFIDNFDSYTPGVPWAGGSGWVTGNSVDLVASGTFGLTCVGGTGNCVDLSGNSPGSISQSILFIPGTYRLSFQYTGNQLDSAGGPFPQSGINFSVGSLNGSVGPLPNNTSVFSTYSGLFTVTGSSPVTLTFSQQPGGNAFRGSILDSVSVVAVPEPATWGLMLLGFGMIGVGARRRRLVGDRASLA